MKYERDGHCLICAKACPEKTSMDSAGWDWFGGYLGVAVHFCPDHKGGELRDRLFSIGEKQPITWSADERAFVEKFRVELERVELSARMKEKRKRR